MNMIRNIVLLILAIPKSIFFNFHYFNLKKEIKLPIIVSHNVRLKKLGGKNSISCPDNFMSVKLGFSNGSFDLGKDRKSYFYQEESSKIEFLGKATLSNNFHIKVNSEANLIFGDNFSSNSNLIISCDKKIEFNNN